jgi:hypothetical protein
LEIGGKPYALGSWGELCGGCTHGSHKPISFGRLWRPPGGPPHNSPHEPCISWIESLQRDEHVPPQHGPAQGTIGWHPHPRWTREPLVSGTGICWYWTRTGSNRPRHAGTPAARVEAYLKAHEGRKLRAHRPDDVVSYLEAVGRDLRLASWQKAQVVLALQLLFCRLLESPWCNEVVWDYGIAAFRVLEPEHATRARENPPAGLAQGAYVQQQTRGEGLLKEIRLGHAAGNRLLPPTCRRKKSLAKVRRL